jgi:flavin reductase (DIM6/NTAB) family NADH-FMN oxidoreductase RutF
MKKWRCKICGYIHVGPNPPEICPLCGATAEFFEPVAEEAGITPEEHTRLQNVLFQVPCGLVIVGTALEGRVNGMINNTVFQITNAPLQIVLGMDKQHLTTDMIGESQVFSIMLLAPEQLPLVKVFGFQSGRQADKFAGRDWYGGTTGAPLLRECAGYFECRVNPQKTLDVGTHLVFLAEVVAGNVPHDDWRTLTYQEYRRRKQELWD